MKSWTNLVSLSLLLACSTTKQVDVEEQYVYQAGSRSIAEVDATKNELSTENIKKTLTGILHSYLLGQVLLMDFDAALDKDGAKALESNTYSELTAIRILVEEFEETVDESYIKLVMISALPKFSEDQKANARQALQLIGEFMAGVTEGEQKLPENLKHLVLGNLREKQTHLFDKLNGIKADPSITNGDPQVVKIIEETQVKLRGTRMNSFKQQKTYTVDEVALAKAVEDLKGQADFKQYQETVKAFAVEIKKVTTEVQRGRSTSSVSIYPNVGAAGNVTGRSFPANTWALTFDDGPGPKTTSAIVKNLQERDLKATFFMLAQKVEGLPKTAQAIVDAGMDVASHSYSHAQLTKVGPAALEQQIGGSKKILETRLDKPIKLFRLPYGAGVSVQAIRAKIAQHHMIHVFWNVDTLDWQDKSALSIFNRAKKQMAASPRNNGVVLFHDIHPQSVTASAMLMDHMKKLKINVCTVQGVIIQMNKGLESCK